MSKNKKIITTILLRSFVMFVIGAVLIVFAIDYSIDYFNNNIAFKTEQEIIDMFKDNKESFVSTADKLFVFQWHWCLRAREKFDEDIRPDFEYAESSNGIQVTVMEEAYFSQVSDIQTIVEEEESIEHILKKLGYKAIFTRAFNDHSIYFMKQSSINYDAGIVYCPKGVPQNKYIVKLVEIEPSWYYYESR